MVEPGTSLLRALSGLSDGTGRTIVVAGPPGSGKSDCLAAIEPALTQSGARVLAIQGSYRERSVSYAVAARIWEAYEHAESETPEAPETRIDESEVPAWGLAYASDAPIMSRQRLQAVGRGGSEVRPEDFWAEFLQDLGADRVKSLAILVDDATLLDHESREFLTYLSARARLRPCLVVLVLDTSVPAYSLWDEVLEKRTDVDWIRPAYPRGDLRDAHRMRGTLKGLPGPGQMMVRMIALLGGSASQVMLGRASHLTLSQVSEALNGPIAANILKIRSDRVTLASEGWVPLIEESIPEDERREMHGRIARALQALHPEPTLERRIDIANHLYGHAKGADAMWALSAAAQLLEKELRFDAAEDLLERAVACATGLASEDRLGVEAALRVARARLLLTTGREEEAEREFRESLGMAVLARLSRERLEELTLSLAPVLRAVGPRGVLMTDLQEIADRFHDAEARTAEMLAISVLIEDNMERGRQDTAREESQRGSRIARELPRGPMQGVALLGAAVPLIEGTEEERKVAAKCIRSARAILATYRRPELQLYADEVHARRLVSRGERTAAITVHEQAIPVAVRTHLPAYELFHQLGLAECLMEERPDPRLTTALTRAEELCGRLYLTGASVPFLKLALLRGRWAARHDRTEEAREVWSAVAEMRSPSVPVQYRAEAHLRLADLELAEHRAGAARVHLLRIERPELLRGLRLDWVPWLADLKARADREDPGGRISQR
ncbi:MAG: AAA family ATPase [Thermoplasmata archaeon]